VSQPVIGVIAGKICETSEHHLIGARDQRTAMAPVQPKRSNCDRQHEEKRKYVETNVAPVEENFSRQVGEFGSARRRGVGRGISVA
jgi:hypothetical protein